MGVGVGADHFAAGGIELKVDPGAAANLQDGELSVAVVELLQAVEQLFLPVVHFPRVRCSRTVHAKWEDAFINFAQAHSVHQDHGPAQLMDYRGTNSHEKSHVVAADLCDYMQPISHY